MICWISSFPRSGNTLTRQILKQSFGLNSYTHFVSEPETDHLFPNQHMYDLNNIEVYRSLKNSDEVFFIKTHYALWDGCPTIHVVRNGRNAISSLAKLKEVPVEPAIVTQVFDFPSWSSHFWSYYNRANSLMLRFEEVLAEPNKAAEQIGMFIGKTPKPFVNEFNAINPVMGSGGKECACFEPATELLFQRCHGVVMSLLGYQ